MNNRYKGISILLLALSCSTITVADENLWNKTKNWAGDLFESSEPKEDENTITQEDLEAGLKWSGDKIEKGANWGVGKAKKGWSATSKGSQTFWQELTSDDDDASEEN